MDNAISPAVADVIESIVSDFGDVEISQDDAEQLFAGSDAIHVKDLTQHQLMQLAICQFRDLVRSMEQIIEGQRHIIQTRAKSKTHYK